MVAVLVMVAAVVMSGSGGGWLGGRIGNTRLRLVGRRVVEMELLRSNSSHDNVEDTELSGSQGADHNPTREQTLCAQLPHAGLGSDVTQASKCTTAAACTRFVDLGEQGIRRVGNSSRSHTSNNAREQRHRDVLTLAHLLGSTS